MASQKDTHIAMDHILSALCDNKPVASILTSAGLGCSELQAAITAMRGTRRTSGKQAEQTYEALEKYGYDLVKAAEDGKLDPVIGRDEEIRRVIRVLARRTKVRGQLAHRCEQEHFRAAVEVTLFRVCMCFCVGLEQSGSYR